MAKVRKASARSRNPYHEGKELSLKPSVFAFVDILGYRDLIANARSHDEQQKFLRKLHAALSKTTKSLKPHELFSEHFETDLFVVKGFTDNIVIGMPIHDDAETELGDAFYRLSEFQLAMVLDGFFVRGAIAVGNAFVDDIVVFGDALSQAYEGESRLARDPRIILMDSAQERVRAHLDYYTGERAPQMRDVLCDSDNQWFLNYLEATLIAEHEYGPDLESVKKHKDVVENCLKEHAGNPNLFAKYAWVANYHNTFCELHSDYFSDDLKIKADLFRKPISELEKPIRPWHRSRIVGDEDVPE